MCWSDIQTQKNHLRAQCIQSKSKSSISLIFAKLLIACNRHHFGPYYDITESQGLLFRQSMISMNHQDAVWIHQQAQVTASQLLQECDKAAYYHQSYLHWPLTLSWIMLPPTPRNPLDNWGKDIERPWLCWWHYITGHTGERCPRTNNRGSR